MLAYVSLSRLWLPDRGASFASYRSYSLVWPQSTPWLTSFKFPVFGWFAMDIRNFFGGKPSQGSSDVPVKSTAKKEVSRCLARERRLWSAYI